MVGRITFSLMILLLIAGCDSSANKTGNTIEGVWRISRIAVDGAEPNNDPLPSQIIFTENHYSIVWMPGIEAMRAFDEPWTPTDSEIIQRFWEITVNTGRYEIADKVHGVACGGIGVIDALARKLGLPDAINERLRLLKCHRPYHESDHVLSIAYNLLCGGQSLNDIEIRRNDEVYLDALGAVRIPDPTTAGDFCRRFTSEDIYALQRAYDKVRLRVWREQPAEFFEQAIIDSDADFKRVMDLLDSGHFNRFESGLMDAITQAIREPADLWMTAADFRSYVNAQADAAAAYTDTVRWTRMSILNTAASGQFSTDRTMRDYNDDIWHLEPVVLAKE